MCGIAGIRSFDGLPVDPDVVRAMVDRLHHRGPDATETCFAPGAGWGHTRLSIIDLAGSQQPMHSHDGRYTLTFNGEIFNYRQLRQALPYPFRTHGDTEVLLASFAQSGPASLSTLVGQFAFALYDRATGDTWMARDRVGVLPLYYTLEAGRLAFASEVKALLPALAAPPALDHRHLRSYLQGRSVPAPHTLFRHVRKVLPGHLVRVSATGEVVSEPYWSLPDPEDVLDVTDDQSVDLVDDCLQVALDSALVADVPVGSYLSGGVDGSLIVALAGAARVRLGQTAPIETFSAEFGDPRFDETTHALTVAGRFGTRHHRVVVDPHAFAARWMDLTWHRDAPISEPADIAVAWLAETARERVKVVLSGEGSDELFGGYPKYRYARATAIGSRVPATVRRPVLREAERALPPAQGRARIALRALTGETMQDCMALWFAPFTDYECDQLLGLPRVNGRRLLESRDPVDLMARTDMAGWLPDNLLERGDRMSMSASLELRPPFLDHRMVDLAFRLPSRVKVKGRTTKWVLKQVALRYLPAAIVTRPKVGFRVPLDAWFRDGLRDLSHDLLTGPDSFVGGVLDQAVVRRLVHSHDSGRRDESIRIWTLLSLEIWGRRFITGASAAL